MAEPITAFVHYRVRPGCEEEFLAVVDRHWPALRDLDLVTDAEAQVYLGFEKDVPGPFIIEVFEWVDEEASTRAHRHPAISGIWESMGPLCEATSTTSTRSSGPCRTRPDAKFCRCWPPSTAP